jgi:hypothetical protein
MSQKFIGQRRWVQGVLKKFGDLEKYQPNPLDAQMEWPDWVQNLLMMLYAVTNPGCKLKNLKKWKPKDLGKFLGRQYAGEQLTRGQVPLSPTVLKEGIQFERWAGAWASEKRPDIDWVKFNRDWESQDKIWKERFKGFMKETLASVCDRPYVEARDFFEAFGKASVIKPDELETERTLGVGDRMCWAIFMNWRDIERLESVAQFHQILEKVAKNRGIVWKYKRTEKFCQRIKLKFRKGPGRPPESKNSDKSPRSLGVISRG